MQYTIYTHYTFSGLECAESRMSWVSLLSLSAKQLQCENIAYTSTLRNCFFSTYLGNEDKRAIKTGITTWRSIFCLYLKRKYNYVIYGSIARLDYLPYRLQYSPGFLSFKMSVWMGLNSNLDKKSAFLQKYVYF